MLLNGTINLLLMASATSEGNNESRPVPQMVNSSFVIDIVGLLHQKYEFINFVFYISESLYRATDDGGPVFLSDFWHNFPAVPVMIITENDHSMMGLLDEPTLCLILTTECDDPIMELAALSLNRQRYFMTIFLLYPLEMPDVPFEQLHESINQIYRWVWHKRFLHTLLITVHNNLYVYDAYPTGTVINKSSDWQVEDFFWNDKMNLKGAEIATPIRHDMPRVFRLTRSPNNRKAKLTGYGGKLFEAFVHHINATFRESFPPRHEFENYKPEDVLKLLQTGEVEISSHIYISLAYHTVDSSYPVSITNWCYMVPFRKPPPHIFLQKCFKRSSWFLLCYSSLYIAVGIWLCTPAAERDLSSSCLQAVCSMLLISPQRILILPYRRIRFLSILLFVMGFCITNLYLSKMAMYLTASFDEEQINTLQDIVDANLEVLVMSGDIDVLLSLNYSTSVYKLLLVVSEDEFGDHCLTFNTTYGCLVGLDRWHFINAQQAYLKTPVFHLAPLCAGPFYAVFPFQQNSNFKQPFKQFILEAQQAGLTFFWENEAFRDALFMGYVQLFKMEDGFTPMSLDFLRSIFFVWYLGLTLSVVTFILEFWRVSIAQCRQLAYKSATYFRRDLSN